MRHIAGIVGVVFLISGLATSHRMLSFFFESGFARSRTALTHQGYQVFNCSRGVGGKGIFLMLLE